MHDILNRVVQVEQKKLFQYSEFDAVEKIGAGGYGTVYKAKCKSLDGVG
jgi:hypothetical protein